MPTYQYSCTECGHFFEQFQSFNDDSLSECPDCGGRLRKVFNAVGVVFKGSGFYRNDSRPAEVGSGSSSNGSSEKAEKAEKSSEKSGSTSDSGSSESSKSAGNGGSPSKSSGKPSGESSGRSSGRSSGTPAAAS